MTTITYVGAGAAATGNNTAITPGAVAGVAVGDLVLVQASTGGTAFAVNVPSGWSPVATAGGNAIFGRIWESGDTLPLVTFTGGVAGNDTIARAFAFRGASQEGLYNPITAVQNNNSFVQNIDYPELDVPGRGHAVVMFLWKNAAATALSTPSGFTAGGLTSATAGTDSMQGVFYRIQTNEVDLSIGTVTVTGGTTAASKAFVVALKPAPTVTAIEQDSWPPRVQVVATDLTLGDNVEVYRVVGGVWSAVRAGAVNGHTDTSFVVIDAEIPFGRPVSYRVYVNGFEYATPAVTYDLPGGKVALSDAITGGVAECVIGAADDLVYERDSARFRAGGRNMVVSGPMPEGATGAYELLATSTSTVEGILWLLRNATQGIVQIRQPGTTGADGNTYDGVDAYLAIDRAVVRRWSQDGSDPRRIIVVDFVQVDGWSPELAARGFTYQDMIDYFGGSGSYQDLVDLFAPSGDYIDAMTADWTP